MLKFPRKMLCSLAISLVAITSVYAADKNGVSPQAISLPSGPGSIEGLGESFQPLLSTGTAAYGLPLQLPTGVAGHSPSLSLSYNSGYSNGPAGRGWLFGPGAISRQTDNGIPRYVDSANSVDDDADGEVDEPDEIDRILGPDGEDLILVEGDVYRARLEGGFARYRRLENSWDVTLKGGAHLQYGLSSQTRVTDATGTRVFKWLLERSTDTNGNVIEYRYSSLPGSDNQKYLTEIRYGPGASPWNNYYFVALTYETRSDWTTDYRSGFLVKTAHRLARVDVGIQSTSPPAQLLQGDWNSDGASDALIRRYTMSYEAHSHWSFLSRVTQFASDAESYLPPISFEYQVFDPPATISATNGVIGSVGEPTNVMDRDQVELVDLNADGLPDLLQTTVGSHVAYINQSAIAAGGNSISWQGPVEVPSDDGLAALLTLASDQVYLSDMDGDGLSDLVQTTVAGDVLYFSNQGTSSFATRRFMVVQDSAPPAPFGNAEVQPADMDFDKHIDIVRSSAQGYSTWYNFGDGRYSGELRSAGATYQGQTILFSSIGVQLADMNGDRLSDVVRVRPTGVVYSASMGRGQFADGILIPIPDQVLTDGVGGQVSKAKLSDISGDGLADLVLERADNAELWYWLNLGNSEFSTKFVVTGMPTAFGVDAVTRWADLNGNGTHDLIYADSTATPRLQTIDISELAGGTANANSLTRIDNGLGVVTNITYRSSSQLSAEAREASSPWQATLPFPVSVVTRVEVRTGLDVDDVPGDDVYVTDYTYRDGYYDFREKEFRGFEDVTVADIGDSTAPTLITRHTFHTGAPDGIDNDADGEIDEVSTFGHWEEESLKGKPLAQERMTTEGYLFDRAEMDWSVRTLLTTPDTVEVRFAELKENRSLIYEGTATPITIRTTMGYDGYGNVVEERRFGSVSIDGDERFTFTEFILDTDRWILNRPSRILETDAVGNQVSESLSYYDGQAYVGLGLGALDKGNLVRQQGWVEGSKYIDLVRNDYDSFGNVVGTRDGKGNLRETTFDNALQIFPVSETVYVGGGSPPLTMTADYNIGFAVVDRSTDFNGNSTDYAHDIFGRPTAVVRPGDSGALPTQSYAYTLADPLNNLQYAYSNAGQLTLTNTPVVASSITSFARENSGVAGTLDTVNYVDGLGRGLATIEEGETGFIVRDAVLFNNRGTFSKSFMPYRVSAASYEPPQTGDRTELLYDSTGREVRRINPQDGNGLLTDVLTSYLPLRRTVSDELRNAMHYVNDGLGRMIQVEEENAGETYITHYEYNPLDSLTRIVDAQNNSTIAVFDGLQRRTFMNQPDRGVMSYIYDDASNLIETIDAKNQRIAYTFDGANRLLTEDYKDEGLPFSANRSPDVSYNYDVPAGVIDLGDGTQGSAANTKGELAWVDDLSGEEHLSYDARGRMAWRVKRVLNPSNSVSEPFRTAMNYDSMDRIVSITYPDNDRVIYQYNSRGLTESIRGGVSMDIVANIDYTSSGQPERLDFGNATATTYGYDARLRLTDLRTLGTGSSPLSLIDFAYTYDAASNIKIINDRRPTSQVPAADARRNTQVFTYDDLYRLESVEYPAIGRIDYSYDRIGNMLSKTSNIVHDTNGLSITNLGTMAYGGNAGTTNRFGRGVAEPPGPHALTSADNGAQQRDLEYDANGNVVLADGMLLAWDFRDRLISVETDESSTIYSYDHNDRRISKYVMSKPATSNLVPSSESTLFIDRYFELRANVQATKYVFNGDTRIARTTGSLDLTSNRVQYFQLHQGWNLLFLGLDASDTASQFGIGSDPTLGEIYRWNPESGEHVLVESSDTLPAGSVIWAFANGPLCLRLRGAYHMAASLTIPAGNSFIGLPWFATYPQQELLRAGVDQIWAFDAASQSWSTGFAESLGFLSQLPTEIIPGQGLFVVSSAALELQPPPGNFELQYYHNDHLGSSTLIADAQGTVIEENAYYPFGYSRSRWLIDGHSADPYQFTGKEFDDESGLHYFEARYLASSLGRFTQFDPILEIPGQRILSAPQQLNPYSYAANNPIINFDPTGMAVETVGQIIERKGVEAAGEGSDSAYAWAGAAAAWSVFGAEGVSKVASRQAAGQKNSMADYLDAGVEVAGALLKIPALKGLKKFMPTINLVPKGVKNAAKKYAMQTVGNAAKSLNKLINKTNKQGWGLLQKVWSDKQIYGFFKAQLAIEKKNATDLLAYFGSKIEKKLNVGKDVSKAAIEFYDSAVNSPANTGSGSVKTDQRQDGPSFEPGD